MGDRLTIKPGIRYEQETLIGTIVQNFTLKNNWAPRIGVDLRPARQRQEQGLRQLRDLLRADPERPGRPRAVGRRRHQRADYFDAGLTQPIPDGVPAGPVGATPPTTRSRARGADLIDPNAKLTYMHEFIGGFEYECVPNLNVGVRYIHRSIPRVLEDVSPFPIVAGDLGLPGAAASTTR